jgi:hypothetical protein
LVPGAVVLVVEELVVEELVVEELVVEELVVEELVVVVGGGSAVELQTAVAATFGPFAVLMACHPVEPDNADPVIGSAVAPAFPAPKPPPTAS